MSPTTNSARAPPGTPQPQYAPHPGAMSGDVWPSLEELTKELTTGTRNRVSTISGISGQSPYDNKFEAAAGAAALVNARPQGGPRTQRWSATPTVMGSFPRKVSLPVRSSPAMAPHPTVRQMSDGWPVRPEPLQVGQMFPALSESPTLPSVVLTPPDDEPGGPIPLYPRSSAECEQFAPTGPARRLVEEPSPSSTPPPPPPQRSAQSAPVVGKGFDTDAPVFSRPTGGAGQVVMPKRPDQVKQERFDADFEDLMNGPPQNGRTQNVPSATRDAPPPPNESQQDKSAFRKSLPAKAKSSPSKAANRQTLPARSPEKPQNAPPVPGIPAAHTKQASDSTTTPTPKKDRRRSLSLSALFSKRKSRANEVPPPMPTNVVPVPPLPPKPSDDPEPSSTPAPETPSAGPEKTEKKARRRTLLSKASLKDLFGASQSQAQPQSDKPLAGKMRRSQSKPELRKGMVAAADAPPVPALPAQGASAAPITHVPDALAALTARSGSKNPPVEFVPDVFAAFSTSAVNMDMGVRVSNVERARAAAPPPAPPMPPGPIPSSAASASVQQKQQFGQSMPNLHKEVRETPAPPLPSAPTTPKKGKKESSKTDEDKQDRRKSLSKRLSLSSLFGKKKASKEEAPEVPAIPAAFERATPPTGNVTSTSTGSGRGVPRNGATPATGNSKAPRTMNDDLPPLPQSSGTPPLRISNQRPALPAQMVAAAHQQPGPQQKPTPRQQYQQLSRQPHPPMQMAQPTVRQQPPQQYTPPQAPQQQFPQAPHVRDSPSPDFSRPFSMKPESTTKPLNIQKRVPVPPVLHQAQSAEVPNDAAQNSTPPPATTHVIPTINTVAPTPTSDSFALPDSPPTTREPNPEASGLRPESEVAGLAYLDTDSEDTHATHPEVQSSADVSSASTTMPSLDQASPSAVDTVVSPETPSSRDSPARPAALAYTPTEMVDDSDPPSPSPSQCSVAEVHTAQTARRSNFRSLSAMEILALSSDDHETLIDLRNVPTAGENQGLVGATAALEGGSVIGLETVNEAVTKDDQEPARAESFIEIDQSMSNQQPKDEGSSTSAVSPTFTEGFSSMDKALDTITETRSSTSSQVVQEPEEMDDLPAGWTKFDPDRKDPVPVQVPEAPVRATKAASEDLDTAPPHVTTGTGSVPTTLSRATAPGRPIVRSSSVLEAIAGTSIGLQPPPPSVLDEAIDDAQVAIENAGSYFASAASRVSRVATGWASAVSTALSPVGSNVDLPNTDAGTPPVRSDSANRESPFEFQSPRSHRSADSTTTFDTAYESADDGDSATFETFETFSTASIKTYTPGLPPPQSSVPNLPLPESMLQQEPRSRRDSVPVSLANSALRRRSASTPLGYQPPDESRGAVIPTRLETASLGAAPRRPYAGRSTTMPTSAVAQGPYGSQSGQPQQSREVLQEADTRCDSPLDLQMPGMFAPVSGNTFVVPFPPDESSQPSTPRSPTTVSHYTPTAAARERTRRDSGITSAVGGLGFARKGPIDAISGVPMCKAPTATSVPVQHDFVNRRSLPTVVDYSARSSMSSRGSIGAEFAMWSEVSNPTIDTVPEMRESEAAAEPEPEHEESFQLDSSSCDSSSGSDELDGAPCTPKTPDLETLGGSPPTAARESTSTASVSSSRENTPSKSGGSVCLTRAPFRAMHYDMSQETDTTVDESFATATEVQI